MRNILFFVVVVAAVVVGGVLRASAEPGSPPPETLSYGADPLQALDFWRSSQGQGTAPLIVFVHGGAWKIGDKRTSSQSAQVPHFLSTGHAFASLNYRLVPAVGVEAQAQDVAQALRFLVERAAQLGVDRKRIVLMGHSAGAHLAALVATDPRYLAQAGLQPGDIGRVILLDGAGYDVPQQVRDAGPMLKRTYLQVFGSDPARQRVLSPIAHVAAPNAGAFLVLHVQREDSGRQSRALAEALNANGTPAEVHALPGEGRTGHRDINVELGDPSYPGTAIVDRWLGGVR